MENAPRNKTDLSGMMKALKLDQLQVVQEHKDFLEFGSADAERLRRLGPRLAGHADRIVDVLYAHLLKFEETRRLLPNEAVIQHLKSTQKAYFEHLFSGVYDARYVEDRLRIGLAHYQVDLKPQWYLGTYNLYLRLILPVIFQEFQSAFLQRVSFMGSGQGLMEACQSVLKIIFFDMGLAIDAYIGSLSSQLEAERRNVESERQALHALIAQIRGSAQQLATAAEGLSAESQQVSASSEQTSRQATAVSAASEETNRNVQAVATAAEEMSATIKEISKNVQEATRITAQAVKVAESVNATIAKLGESSGEIGKVIKVITTIAQQTNLLALNATIEAARAGEAGKGFAVVANEVKDLAKETARATEEIGQKIGAIQVDTQEAVAAIGEIGKIIGQINEISTTIAGAIEEQAVTTGEISRNVAEAARGTGEVVQNIAGVASATKGTAQGAANILAASRGLSKVGTELDELMKDLSEKSKRAHSVG